MKVIAFGTLKGGTGKTTVAYNIGGILAEEHKVLFIDDGRLAAFGKHTDLYETCEAYRKMVDLQKLEEEGGAENA